FLLASGFRSRNAREVRRKIVCWEILNRHLDQAYERTFKIRLRIAAAIDNYADRRDDPAMGTDDIDCFLNTAAARHHILHDDEFFVRRNLKTAAQGKFAFVLFDKDVAFAEGTPDFLADNNSPESWGDDRVTIKFPQFIGELSAHLRSDVGVLQEDRTLEILAAMQARAQNEVAIQQRTGLAEKREKIFAHFVVGRLICSPPPASPLGLPV